MEQAETNESLGGLRVALAAVISALLCSWALAATSAEAGFEGVGHFAGSPTPVQNEEFDEEVQLAGVGGMAVNVDGAGGVPAGTVYAATFTPSGGVWTAMYEPDPGGGLKFGEAWEVKTLEAPYKRCGPLLGEEGGKAKEPCTPRVKSSTGRVDVDVDQSTGNVYVFNAEVNDAGNTMITAYTPDGSEVLARFGEKAPGGPTTAETPDKIHQSNFPGGMAVNEAGEVYVFDLNGLSGNYTRLMKFDPKVAGQYDEYEYAGTSEDVGAGVIGEVRAPMAPILDAEGDIYVASDETHVEKYNPEKSKDTPVCRFDYPKGGITSLTVNPESGEAFFYSSKAPKRIHQLGPCDEASGKFKEIGLIEVKPERDDVSGLAFDPVRQFSLARAPGTLYAGAPGPKLSDPTQSSLGYIFAALEENPPVVEAQSASGVRASSAQLNATIGPKGNQTDYVFQLMTEAAYQEAGETFAGAAEAPLGGAPAGEGGVPIAVAATLSGLSPDTEYRYRAIATSNCSEEEPEKVCEGIGAPERFRTYPLAAGLPDNRAYELVSPAQKNGGQVMPAQPAISSCGSEAKCKPGINGDRFPMQSAPDGDAVAYQGTGFAPGVGALENQYVARRTASGWQSASPTPQLLNRGEGNGYKALDEELGEAVLRQLSPSLSPEAPSEYDNLYAQPTRSPFALSPLLSAEPPNRPALGSGSFTVRYVGASADLSRVFFEANDALTEEVPGIAPTAEDGGSAKFNLYEWERASGQLRLVNVEPGNTETEAGASFGIGSAHTISEDGSRVFWSDGAGQAYAREGAEATREIPDPGKFLSAAFDGSRVLLTNGHLYDLESESTTDLTEGKGGFKGLVGQSEDLSRVYFVDTEVLSGEEENSEGDKAEATKFNLYAWSEGTTRFVATLVAGDNGGGSLDLARDWAPAPSDRTAEASPAGRYLAFLSQAPLTGYDNTGLCETDHAGGFVDAPCPQVFLYDLASGELSCASCSPTGTRPLGYSVLRLIQGPNYLPQARYLTDSGRLYFDSQDSLSLADTNEGVEDVYQHEPEGVGDCKREDGCLSLISAGREAVDSNFLAADETGKNVFFTSRDRLVQRDKDELIDLYVAREGGGIAAETETTRSECQGEACQPAAFAPSDPTPGSSSFTGPGNVKQSASKPRCPKGRRLAQRKGKPRCVKRKRARVANRNRGGAK